MVLFLFFGCGIEQEGGLIFAGVILHAWYFGVAIIGWPVLIALGGAALLSFVIDYVASAYGAKRFGSTKYGIIGAIAGGSLGTVLFSLPGLVLSIFIGATAAEIFFARKKAGAALRVGWGTIVGFGGGTVVKFLVGLAMIITFVAVLLF